MKAVTSESDSAVQVTSKSKKTQESKGNKVEKSINKKYVLQYYINPYTKYFKV